MLIISTGRVTRTLSNNEAIVIDCGTPGFWRRGRFYWCGNGRAALCPAMFRITTALLVRSPNLVSTDELIDAAYRGDHAGGPICADDCVRTTIATSRRRLFPWLGVRVIGRPTRGYTLEPITRSH